jgi:CDK inhibitor PHO81
LSIDFVPEINDFVDSILQTVFESAENSTAWSLAPDSVKRNRTILFSSFNPDICTALNWKQPNCTTFSQ